MLPLYNYKICKEHGVQLFALIYIQLSLKHIYQTGHSITSVT